VAKLMALTVEQTSGRIKSGIETIADAKSRRTSVADGI
jgi:hypothetical protein